MGNGALPNGPSYRAHPRLYHFRDDAMSGLSPLCDPGCVKTCTSRECAELFSLFSSFDGDCQSGSFVIQRNRDKLSTRKFNVGVFTMPRSKADLGVRRRNVRFHLAGSTGRRNTGVKSLCWGFKLQGLTWSFVELTSHFVQIGLRMHRQVGALRKVLSQQAIGVLVRPALPRALRIAKIDVDFGPT